MRLNHIFVTRIVATLVHCSSMLFADSARAADLDAVVENYANIAHASYGDSLSTARELMTAVDALLQDPSDETLNRARGSWIAARVPYQQTEAYRFGNAIVDDWEGKVNAWPLDEGLIDYVAGGYGGESEDNKLYVANVIANPKLTVGGRLVDATNITPELLAGSLHEADNIEANVATGYHAIEFLLWGQDLNGTGPGAGNRPATDFDVSKCTNGNCDRRSQYLRAATELLINDLEWMVAQWDAGGAARKSLTNNPNAALIAIFTGLGSLSYGELAGERMKLGLLLHDPEEEHDCFSDNTHNSHYYDALGMQNVYLGRYVRTDGSTVSGASVSELVRGKDAGIDARVRAALTKTMQQMSVLKKRAEAGEAYDQMIGEGNTVGNTVVQAAIDALIGQAKEFERAIAALELKPIQFEGSDSLE